MRIFFFSLLIGLPSILFSQNSGLVEQWKQALAGAKLTYIYSGYTSGSGGGGATTTVDLCANGRFHYVSESSVYVTNAGGYGNSSRTELFGQWQVQAYNGQVYLTGQDTHGQSYAYLLSYSNNQVYLNQQAYYLEAGKASCW